MRKTSLIIVLLYNLLNAQSITSKQIFISPDYSKNANPKELSEFIYNYEMNNKKSFFGSEINFAGDYIINFDNSNPDRTVGKMIDTRTGIVYSFPDQLKKCNEYTNDFRPKGVEKNSNEIAIEGCDSNGSESFINIYQWDEIQKNFTLMSRKKNNYLQDMTIDNFWNYLAEQAIANKNLNIPVNSLAKMLAINLADQIEDKSEELKIYIENENINIDLQSLSNDYSVLTTGFGNASSNRTNIFKKNNNEYVLLDINAQLRNVFSKLSAKGFKHPRFESCYSTALKSKKYLVLEVRTDKDPGCCTSLRLLIPFNELEGDLFASQNLLYGVSSDGSIENIQFSRLYR